MSFIGIIHENEQHIMKYLFKHFKNRNHTILCINRENIDNIKNVKFQTILIINDITKEFENYDNLKFILKNAANVIMNADIEENLKLLENLEVTVITYGFNQKSTVIASSVTEEEILICIQRQMKTIQKKLIEPQEVNINLIQNGLHDNIYSTIGMIVLFLVYGILETS